MNEIPTIKVRGKEIPHNGKKWHLATNRHTSTRGHSWGWIEGTTPEVCWTNDSDNFNQYIAAEVVLMHNRWLEKQRPIEMRILEAKEKLSRLKIETGAAERKYNEALNAESLQNQILSDLELDREVRAVIAEGR